MTFHYLWQHQLVDLTLLMSFLTFQVFKGMHKEKNSLHKAKTHFLQGQRCISTLTPAVLTV